MIVDNFISIGNDYKPAKFFKENKKRCIYADIICLALSSSSLELIDFYLIVIKETNLYHQSHNLSIALFFKSCNPRTITYQAL